MLSIFVDEIMSTPKIITFLPNPIPRNEKLPCLSNPISYSEYLYLSTLTCLVKLTAPNKIFSSVESLLLVLSFLFIS